MGKPIDANEALACSASRVDHSLIAATNPHGQETDTLTACTLSPVFCHQLDSEAS
jgi:hypothetical protein